MFEGKPAGLALPQGGNMIIEFLLSCLVLLISSIFGTLVSGGVLFDALFYPSDIILFGLLVVILGVFIFISGYGKVFVKIFSSRKNFRKLELGTLKEIEKSIVYASKVAVYEAIFFVCIGTVYFYVNWMNTQTLGFQLSLMILSLRYICTIEILLFSMKAIVKKQIILFMADAESNNETGKKSNKVKIISLLKVLIFSAILFGLAVFVVMNYTRNESEIYFGNIGTWFDLPSLILVIAPTLLLLSCNGLWKDFFSGIKAVAKGEEINISEKYRFENAVSTVRYIVLCLSVIAAMLGYYAVLTYLDHKAALGPNMMIATIPCFYAVIMNLILLSVEAKLNHMSE